MFDDILVKSNFKDAVHERDGEWYFWDEVWTHAIGPFGTEKLARHNLKQYVRELNGIRNTGGKDNV
jgi:hypothetical protein